jgi:hypothetical protein
MPASLLHLVTMTPRRYRPDPNRQVIFGRWLLDGDEGELPENMIYSNPPLPKDGITLITRKRGRRYWMKLRKTDLLSQQEAAAFLRVSRMQVNRWVNNSQLADTKILGTSRIAVSTLLDFAKEKKIALVRGPYLIN